MYIYINKHICTIFHILELAVDFEWRVVAPGLKPLCLLRAPKLKGLMNHDWGLVHSVLKWD